MGQTVSFLLAALLGGCASSTDTLRDEAVSRARAKGMRATTIEAGRFSLFTLSRGLEVGTGTVVVYIEGDGHAWRTSRTPSADPTPRTPYALELALRDPRPAVLYLARPCQFVAADARESCLPRYWTQARFAPEVVDALNRAISASVHPGSPIGLIGFSGGGALAALVAARREDVQWLITIAGNLDHQLWTSLHAVTPLTESLNPADVAGRLSALPQVHWSGAEDAVVPAAVARSYLSRMPSANRALVAVEPGFGHHCCWAQRWPKLLCRHRLDPGLQCASP